MTIDEYLQRLTAGLEADPLRRDEIRLEVHGHLRERVEELAADGMERAAAEDRAMEEFGPPEEYARALSGPGRLPTWLRMDRHIVRLGWCYVAYAVVGILILASYSLLAAGGYLGEAIRDAALAEAAQPQSGFVNAVVAAAVILYLIAGMGLVRRRPWARLLAFACVPLHIGMIPIGTVLGLYALWVLLHPTVRRRMARAK